MAPRRVATRHLWTNAVNSSPLRQDGRHFADDIFKYIFMNGKLCILIWIPQNFVPNGPIDNKAALVQVMAWRETATAHYIYQCWPTSLHGTRVRWVNMILPVSVISKIPVESSGLFWYHTFLVKPPISDPGCHIKNPSRDVCWTLCVLLWRLWLALSYPSCEVDFQPTAKPHSS